MSNRIPVKGIAINVLLVLLSLLVCFAVLETVLATGWLDGEDNPRPVWIPEKFKQIDQEIDRRNREFAQSNPYRFTDKVRTFEKGEGVVRIAVLGDSFIWGDGIPYELTWGHKLEKKVDEKYENVEVMSWGRGGWSTMDEGQFLEEHGVQYDIDVLIVGFVTNDPDFGDIPYKDLTWQDSELLKPLRAVFPNSVDFISAYVNNILITYFLHDYGYINWENKLYSTENLARYLDYLQYLTRFCDEQHIDLLFVLTPNTCDEGFRQKYDVIIPLLDQARIAYLDLYPAVKRDFGHINQRELWANPADGHPGALVTDVYANEVFDYLERQGIVSQGTRRAP